MLNNGVEANVCAQADEWTYFSLSNTCELGGGTFPAPMAPGLQDYGPFIGTGAQAIEMSQAFPYWFDIGYDDGDAGVLRFAYVYSDSGHQHVQVVELDQTGACRSLGSTAVLQAVATNDIHQQFWPMIQYTDRSILDPLAAGSSGLGWQAVYMSNHRAVNANDRYVAPYGTTITNAGLFDFVSLVPGAANNYLAPRVDNFVCADTQSLGISGFPPNSAWWGDYFGSAQIIVPSVSTSIPLFDVPGWMNLTAFPYSGHRPAGQASPCVVTDPDTSDPQHIDAMGWLQVRFN